MRQARSELTRRRIVDAAVHLFGEIGYASTGLSDIIEHAGLTKGAFYYHFDSKQTVAEHIIDEGGAAVLNALRGVHESPTPALEGIIHGSFTIIE
ncbi:TetR family transcriptional regulator, partial [Micromonospora sp. WMMD736]|uniref:TetR family transcriptional regulator n=1 Tax=Micromonospora sp. WMMD736 TaxID=3404112 RepID=UPI003B956EDE